MCASQGQSLADIAYDAACDPTSAMYAKVTCCGDEPPPPEPPPPTECFYEVAGNPGTCSPNVALKDQAAQKCLAVGLELADVSYDNACGGDASNFAKFVCCEGGEPPPPPPPPACFGELLGDPLVCSDNKLLDTKAWYACDAAGATVVSVTFADPCGPNASHYAAVECCFPPPPPPPGECFGEWVGEPGVCIDNKLLGDKAAAVCASHNAAIGAITFDDACGLGTSSTAKFSCCNDPEPPPPPPEPLCTPEALDASKCVTTDQLAIQAKDLCASKGATVEGLVFTDGCAPGSAQTAQFLCCQANPPPPPPSCWGAGFGASTCTSNDSLKQTAETECNNSGSLLSAINYDNACGPSSSTTVSFVCCTANF
jgi:hypothetical protein